MSTKIEWATDTWNPIAGCTPISPGCLNCYAATMANRLHGMTLAGRSVPGYESPPITDRRDGRRVFNGTVRTLESKLLQPLRWRTPRRVFVNSMSDLFHRAVPTHFIDRVFATMALCPQHLFQLLTKRPERAAEYLTDEHAHGRVSAKAEAISGGHGSTEWPLPNVVLGTSVEHEGYTDRINVLSEAPAAAYFVSVEPLIAAAGGTLWVALSELADRVGAGRVQVIVGGESGPRARPCHVEWVRDVVIQADAVGCRVFVKQLGSNPHWMGQPLRLRSKKGSDQAEWPEDLRRREEIDTDHATGDKR